jgi:DNA-binding NarL/FixJ family response regulator
MRIVIAAVQPLLREMIENAIAAEPDMVIVGPVKPIETTHAAAERLHADVVIVGNSDKDQALQLLRGLPRLKVFVLAGNGRYAMQYDLRLNQQAFADISLGRLISAIRAAVTQANNIVGRQL